MSGSQGDGRGTVYLAHAWVPVEHHKDTVGPWHWWNVYQNEATAASQAVRATRYSGWKEYALWETRTIS
jgi:hypothetical protein